MAKRIFEKAELIPGFQLGARAANPSAEKESRSKTAPGTMMGFLTQQSTAVKEAEALRAEVEHLRSSSPLIKLDPSHVKPSRWANRHPTAFLNREFEDLKADISAAGGNVQPIKVRPIALDLQQTSTPTYELIYGHRRHRACLELGLQVNAIVEPADDVSLFHQMERENRGRANLSAWEQGKMYARALDDGLFASQRRMSESLGIDLSQISRTVSLARLPEEVIQAFETPLDIQFRWAAPLAEAIQRDPDGVLARSREVRAAAKKQSAAITLDYLTRAQSGTPAESVSLPIQKAGKMVGQLRIHPDGKVQLTVKAGAASSAKARGLAKLIEDYLAK